MRRLFFFVFLLVSLFLSPSPFPLKLAVIPLEEPRPEPQFQIVEGRIKRKATFYESLQQNKIPTRWVNLILSELKPYVDFNSIQGGTYRLIRNTEGELMGFLFEKNPTQVYEIEKTSKGYATQRKEVSLKKYLVRIDGEIHSSLYEAINAAGEKDPLALAIAEILTCEIDFYQDLREGDRFRVLVEKIYKGDQFVQYGMIRGVEFEQSGKTFRGIWYRDHYYDEGGVSLNKPFLKAPLRFDRISSRFSGARRHPILGGMRPHYGVDYAAPIGTPVRAVAEGTVLYAGWNGGFGKRVVIRHRNGYRTYYGHLLRYGPGIKRGVSVEQKQIIGYVGSTGLSTGPHLDFRITKDGRFKNPLKEVFPNGCSIGERDLDAFEKKKDEIVTILTGSHPYWKIMETTTSEALQKS